MKKQIAVIILSVAAFSASAQETNQMERPPREGQEFRKDGEQRQVGGVDKKGDYHERRLQLMEDALKKLGVTEEQKIQIEELQKAHNEKMKANMQRMNDARKKLSDLQNQGAPETLLGKAIDEVCAAQKEQLWILVKNRKEMERILGKEKFDEFMNSARQQYKKHGRRGGSGIPPLPDNGNGENSPPIPRNFNNPPTPQSIPPVPEV